jgi:hypothetical protein
LTIVDGFLYSASAVSLRVVTVIRKKPYNHFIAVTSFIDHR